MSVCQCSSFPGKQTEAPTPTTAASVGLLQLLTGPPVIQFLKSIIFSKQKPPGTQNLKRGKMSYLSSLLVRIGCCRGNCCHRRQLLARPGGAGWWWQTEASLRISCSNAVDKLRSNSDRSSQLRRGDCWWKKRCRSLSRRGGAMVRSIC